MSQAGAELLIAERPASVGAERDGAKLRQILDGARKVFFAAGFDGASMNDIARAAGVSKGTLYVYFQSKQALFAALIREDHAQQAERICNLGDTPDDLEGALRLFGVGLLKRMCEPDSLAHVRAVLSVASKFPEVGRAFYEAGPLFGVERLAEFLSRHIENGRLQGVDSREAATTFINLCQGDYFKRLLFRMSESPANAEIESGVERAVAFFMRLFAVEKPATATIATVLA